MSTMRLELTNDDGAITLRLYADDTKGKTETVIRDTANGTEVRTEVTTEDGKMRVVTDKTDRTTPPLAMLLGVVQGLFVPFATNAQGKLNHQRYERLKREGKPITVQNMCMDGHHTSEEYADVPFLGGIVGVENVDAPTNDDKVDDDFLARLWGDDEREVA